jgi:hypothetical protein
VLSDGSQVVETSTTVQEEEEYYVQIQGSDRKYPAIILRRKHRGDGATILTISKHGQHSDLYADYEAAVTQYITEREKRLDNTRQHFDNTGDGKDPTTRDAGEGSPESPEERWINQALRGSFNRPDNRRDNSAGD